MRSLKISAVGSFLLSSYCFAQQNAGCIDTINNIALRETLVTDTSFPRTYVLCPLSVYEVGTINFDNEVQDGQTMLPLRPNMKIQCGADGSRDNSCVIFGGDVQIDGTFHYGLSKDRILDNIEFEGITFFSTTKHHVWLTQPGSITFTDCEFRENTQAIAPILLDYFDVSNPTSELKVTFNRCTFEDNKYFGEPAHAALVVGLSRQNRLIFEENRFNRNNMKDALNSTKTKELPENFRTFLIETSGPLTMNRNCFSHNKVTYAPVGVYGSDTLFAENYQDLSIGDVCSFVSNFENDDQFDANMPRCRQFEISGQGAECPISATSHPTGTPTIAPTGAPTNSPTVSPTSSPTSAPTPGPTTSPTLSPTGVPTTTPTVSAWPSPDTPIPTATVSTSPTLDPTNRPSLRVTAIPTSEEASPSTAPSTLPVSPPIEDGEEPAAPQLDFRLTSPPTIAPANVVNRSSSVIWSSFWMFGLLSFMLWSW